jgi:hypothetical protein
MFCDAALETWLKHNEMRGAELLKTMNLEWKRAASSP